MFRLSTLTVLAMSILVLCACGSEEPEALNLPTPVPVYTASADVATASESDLAGTSTAKDEAPETPTPEPVVADENDDAAEGSAQPAGASAHTSSTDAVSGPEALIAGSDALDTADAADTYDLTTTEAISGAASAVDIVIEPTASEFAVDSRATSSATEPVTVAGIVIDTVNVDVESDIAEAAVNDGESTAAIETTPAATEVEIAPEGGESSDAEEAESIFSDEDDVYAGLPASIVALMADADPARGEQLTLQNGCIGCHNLDPDVPMAGPTWYSLAETAATRIDGESAASYLYNSIVNTNDYIVEGYAANIMLQTYGDTLSDQDLSDLIAYLLTLEDER